MSKRCKAAYLRALCRDKRKTEREGRREKVCVCESENERQKNRAKKGRLERKKIYLLLCVYVCMHFFETSTQKNDPYLSKNS